MKISAQGFNRKALEQDRPSKKIILEIREHHLRGLCRFTDEQKCIKFKWTNEVLNGVLSFSIKIHRRYICNPYWRFNIRLPDYLSIDKRFKKQFAFLYPHIAYYKDPITIVNILDKVQSDKPETFKCFVYKYIWKRPGRGLQAYADNIYGPWVRRPWQSKT